MPFEILIACEPLESKSILKNDMHSDVYFHGEERSNIPVDYPYNRRFPRVANVGFAALSRLVYIRFDFHWETAYRRDSKRRKNANKPK